MEAALLSGPRPLVKSPPLISFTSSGHYFPATCRSVSFRHPSMSLTNGSMRISLPNVPRPTSWFLNKLPRPLNKDNNDGRQRTQLTTLAGGLSNSDPKAAWSDTKKQWDAIQEEANKEKDNVNRLHMYMDEYNKAIKEENPDLAVLLDEFIGQTLITQYLHTMDVPLSEKVVDALKKYLEYDNKYEPPTPPRLFQVSDDDDDEEQKQECYLREIYDRQLLYKFIIYTRLKKEEKAKKCAKKFREVANSRAKSFMTKVAKDEVTKLMTIFEKYQA